MIRVLVVDDHDLVRTGITRMLADIDGLQVVGEADSGEAALNDLRAAGNVTGEVGFVAAGSEVAVDATLADAQE